MELPGTVYGTLVHRCFEVLGQNPALADRLSDAVGYPLTQGQIAVLTQGAAKFEAWLQARIAPVEIMREWPFVAQDDAGTVWSGTIDCLVKTAEGWWIIDHKTEGGGDAGAAVERHWPQLDSYRATLEAMGMRVVGVVVNLVIEGKVGVARVCYR
jgi:ATP-dependent exoDNAse (exonuclease V) beta subunit